MPCSNGRAADALEREESSLDEVGGDDEPATTGRGAEVTGHRAAAACVVFLKRVHQLLITHRLAERETELHIRRAQCGQRICLNHTAIGDAQGSATIQRHRAAKLDIAAQMQRVEAAVLKGVRAEVAECRNAGCHAKA